MLVNYFAWQVLPIIAIGIGKIITISKKPIQEAVLLNNDGIKLLNSLEQPFYPYSNIHKIKMESKLTNGYLVLKDTQKKVNINSVAINIEDQRDIVAQVKKNISK